MSDIEQLRKRFDGLKDKKGSFWKVHPNIANPEAWFRDVVAKAEVTAAESMISELEIADLEPIINESPIENWKKKVRDESSPTVAKLHGFIKELADLI